MSADTKTTDFAAEAKAYRAAGHGLKEAEACLADFKKQGREDKVAYYTGLIAALKKGAK